MQAGFHSEDVSIKLFGIWLETNLTNPVHGLDPLENSFVIRNGKYSVKCFDCLEIPENVCENICDDTLQDNSVLDVYFSTDESDESDESDED